MNTAPLVFKTELQQIVCMTLKELNISFERVETDEVITMDDCVQINQRLDMKIVKTLFLCNRQQADFYLFITAGDKPFKLKDFSYALWISRVLFASVEFLQEIFGIRSGTTPVFCTLMDEFIRFRSFLTVRWFLKGGMVVVTVRNLLF